MAHFGQSVGEAVAKIQCSGMPPFAKSLVRRKLIEEVFGYSFCLANPDYQSQPRAPS